MNFLELVQRVGLEVGASGSITTVVGATGEYARLKNWIAQAWIELQMEHTDWRFMRAGSTLSTIAGTSEYDVTAAPISLATFANFVPNTFRIYETTGDEQYLYEMDWDSFRDEWIFGSNRTSQSRPQFVTVKPDKKLVLAQIPDKVYTVVFDYYKLPTELSLDADTPNIPTRFHMLMVYKAMEWYASYENAPEVATRGAFYYAGLLDNLRLDQLLDVTTDRSFL
jgi:hypothetical protein